VLTATTIVAVPAVFLSAATAHASETGKASAVALHTSLDVNLGQDVRPLTAELNRVNAPSQNGEATEKGLTAKVDGYQNGKPFSLLKADVATTRASADDKKAEAYANLVKARIMIPGMLKPISVETLTANAVCVAGEKPTAEASTLKLNVFGDEVVLDESRSETVDLKQGKVTVDLNRESTESNTAAATALELKVTVEPVDPAVKGVSGTVTLADVSCESPAGAGDGDTDGQTAGSTGGETGGDTGDTGASNGSGDTGSDTETQTGSDKDNLAETGGSSATPFVAAGAAALIAAGGGALLLTRRRKAAAANG